MTIPNVYLKPEAVCEMAPGLTKGALAQHRYKGTGPKFLKPSAKLVLYREADVIAWLEDSEHTRTDRPTKESA